MTDQKQLQQLAWQITRDIDTASVAQFSENKFRTHLGASIIGNDCLRFLVYTFRWFYQPVHTGQQLRLFNEGHRFEPLVIKLLRNAGYEYLDVDPATGKQFTINAVMGHFGGSCDGFIRHDERLPLWALAEIKTHNDSSFDKLHKVNGNAVAVSKPVHWAQMNTYGRYYDVNVSVYLAYNKDNSTISTFVYNLDATIGDDMLRKAEYVIRATGLPARIAKDASYYICKMCDMVDVCWKKKKAAVNCRSCNRSCPTENKTWTCLKYGMIPADVIPVGCADHQEFS